MLYPVKVFHDSVWQVYENASEGNVPTFFGDQPRRSRKGMGSMIGRWIIPFPKSKESEMDQICHSAVATGITLLVRRGSLPALLDEPEIPSNIGVCCFYAYTRDDGAHRRILRFLADNHLIGEDSGWNSEVFFLQDDTVPADLGFPRVLSSSQFLEPHTSLKEEDMTR